MQRDKSWRNPGFAVYYSPFPVLQPFLYRLITANVKLQGNYSKANLGDKIKVNEPGSQIQVTTFIDYI